MEINIDAFLEKIKALIEEELNRTDTHSYEYNMIVSEKVVLMSSHSSFQKELNEKLKIGEYLVCKFNYFDTTPLQDKIDRLVLALELLKGTL